jgi:hypothetical protein
VTRHGVLGWTPRGGEGVVVVTQARQIEALLGRLEAAPCAALATTSNLLTHGATAACVAVMASPEPDAEALLAGLKALSAQPGILSVAAPGVTDAAALVALARGARGLTWAGARPGERGPTPWLFVDAASVDEAAALREAAGDPLIPTLGELWSQPPGAARELRLPPSTLAQAAWLRAPEPAQGAHRLVAALPPAARAEALALGAAALEPAPGRRVALRLALPEGLPRCGASLKDATEAAPDALREALDAILREERARGPEGLRGRLMRRWTAALEAARRQGALYDQGGARAYQIAEVAPGEFEIWLRRSPRAPTQFILKSFTVSGDR